MGAEVSGAQQVKPGSVAGGSGLGGRGLIWQEYEFAMTAGERGRPSTEPGRRATAQRTRGQILNYRPTSETGPRANRVWQRNLIFRLAVN